MATYKVTITGRPLTSPTNPFVELGTGTLTITDDSATSATVALDVTSGSIAPFSASVTATTADCGDYATAYEYLLNPALAGSAVLFLAVITPKQVSLLKDDPLVSGLAILATSANTYVATIMMS